MKPGAHASPLKLGEEGMLEEVMLQSSNLEDKKAHIQKDLLGVRGRLRQGCKEQTKKALSRFFF